MITASAPSCGCQIYGYFSALQARVAKSARSCDTRRAARKKESRNHENVTVQICLLVLVAVLTVVTLAVGAAAQNVEVVVTGHTDLDVPAVQAAVDQGGHVTLIGHFSFDRSPTVLTALPDIYPPATVRVSKSVSISGVGGEHDEMTTIDGGTIPFYVEAPGASVTIQSLRFERPILDAIFVYAVNGLTITKCKFKGIVPTPFGGTVPPAPTGIAIDINTVGHVPMPMQGGHPENISGRLLITNNDIDLESASAAENRLGITVFAVGGSPDREADIYVFRKLDQARDGARDQLPAPRRASE